MGNVTAKFVEQPENVRTWPLDFSNELLRKWREHFSFAFTLTLEQSVQLIQLCSFASKVKPETLENEFCALFIGTGGEGQ